MSAQHEKSPTPIGSAGAPEEIVKERDNSSIKPASDKKQASKWREKYRVHPAADILPMISDEEIAKLGEDIKKNGLKQPIIFQHADGDDAKALLLDGRNRLEAMERAGISLSGCIDKIYRTDDPVALIISLNIKRRHLTKEQQADLVVAAIRADADARKADKYIGRDGGSPAPEKLVQLEAVSKGGRGKKNPVKARAIAEGKKAGISDSTMKRSLAKAKPEPKVGVIPKPYAARPTPKPRHGKPIVGLEALRRAYLDACADPDVDLQAELDAVVHAIRTLQGERMAKQAAESTKPVPEEVVNAGAADDAASEEIKVDENGYPIMPSSLRRRP